MNKKLLLSKYVFAVLFIFTALLFAEKNIRADENVTAGVLGAIETSIGTKKSVDVPIRINEVISSNTSVNKYKGDYHDMIEIINVSDKTVFLGGYYISDSKKHLKDYHLPRVSLKPGKTMFVYCMGDNADRKYARELPFKLDSDGEKVYLANKNGEIIDVMDTPKLPVNVSYGLSPNLKSYRYYATPSFGKANKRGYAGIAASPEPTIEDGFYSSTVRVRFKNKLKDGLEIYYTTDGSKPTTSSKKYSGETITMSKTGSIRAFSVQNGCINSAKECFCYFIGQPKYTCDTLMVSMDSGDFSSLTRNYNSKTKYAANLTLYSNGEKQFSEAAGITANGCTSRSYDKKSYRIKFSTKYGSPKLKYKLFDDLDIKSFDQLVLRGGSQDNESAMMRDEFVTSLTRKGGVVTDVITQAYRPVNLYVNGDYRGVYYIREHIDSDMVANHYGCSAKDVTVVQQMTCESGKDGNEWISIYNYAKNHDLSTKENYDYIKKRVSLESVADYYLIEIWTGNTDRDNVRICKANGKWHYALFDLDLSLYGSGSGSKSAYVGSMIPYEYTYNALVYKLLQNKDFRELWNKRANLLFGKNGVFSDKNAKKQINKIYNQISHDMKYNCQRWAGHADSSGDVSYRSYDNWKAEVNALKKRMNGRAAIILRETKY